MRTTVVHVQLFMIKQVKMQLSMLIVLSTFLKKTIDGNTYVLLQNTTTNTPLGWFNVKDLKVQNSSSEQNIRYL